MLRLILLLILVSQITFGGLSQNDSLLKNFVNNEILYWENLYDQNLLILDTKFGVNYVLNDTLIIEETFHVNNQTYHLAHYICTLKPNIIRKTISDNDTLSFYFLKSGNKFYRLFGFAFCDYQTFLFDKNINSNDFYKMVKKNNNIKVEKFKKLKNAIKKNHWYFQNEIEFLRVLNIFDSHFVNIIQPLPPLEFGR
jgi:hypothetical protein